MKPVPDRVIALDYHCVQRRRRPSLEAGAPDNRHAGEFSGSIVLRELLARDDEAIE
jgi:hypothetical protein